MIAITEAVEFRPLDSLHDSPDNPRVHPEQQITSLMDAMQKFGFHSPIIVDEAQRILAGHGRAAALRRIYADGGRVKGVPPGTAPVVAVSGLSEAEKKAYVIADNRLGSLSAFDATKLLSELSDLSGEGFDAASLYFTEADVARMEDDAAREALAGADDPDADSGRAFASGERVPPTAVRFEVMLQAEGSTMVYEAIVRARERFGVANSGDALAALVNAVSSAL